MSEQQDTNTVALTRRRQTRADRSFVPPSRGTVDGVLPACLSSGQRIILSRSLGPVLRCERLLFVASDTETADYALDLRDLRSALRAADLGAALLAVPSVLGDEAEHLRGVLDDERAPATLPLFGLDETLEQAAAQAVVGAESDRSDMLADASGVVVRGVTRRELMAAQRLLVAEEAIKASVIGAAGLAALIRFVQDDRRLSVRARRLPSAVDAVVVVR